MVAQADELSKEKVVISGIAGRYPNSSDINELEKNLLEKVDCTTTEHGRWDFDSKHIPKRLGITKNINKFDRVFFGVHPRLATAMDPSQRICMEHCFEALVDAGINPRSLKGKNIAVYHGSSMSETERSLFRHNCQKDGFGMIGASQAMIPNRVSFFFGLTGPSYTVYNESNACALALEIAYRGLKEGKIDGALITGSVITLHPQPSYRFREAGLLSYDGLTKCFDDRADGFTRSEAISAIYVQRASDAKRIYMEIVNVRYLHSECYDPDSLMFPKSDVQALLMKNILDDSGLTPDQIDYFEANGTAIQNMDTDELEAIDAVYGKRKEPLLVGSIKSNVGDCSTVNTILALIKTIIMANTGKIVPNLNYEIPNSKVSCLKEGRIRIATEVTPFTGKYIAVNSTTLGGNFTNIILKVPEHKKKNNGVPDDDLSRIVVVSGRTEESIKTILDYISERPLDVELLQLLYDVFDTEIEGHLYRGYTIIPAKGLAEPESRKQEILFNSGDKKEIWWIFSGMGSQWVGMGEDLLKLPVFEASIRKCDAVLKPHGVDIYKIITDKDPKTFNHIVNSFVGIAAIQIGLVDVLRSVGLKPDYIIGHSVGELGCAYADGCFTAEQMILAAYSRGLASVESELIRGSMAAVGLGYDDVKPLCPPEVDIACHNGPNSSTISGPADIMKQFVAKLTANGIFAREVPCSNIAYHSRYIAPAGPKLMDYLQKIIPNPQPRSSKWVSSSVPQSQWDTSKARLSSAEYHTNNLLSPVLFDETSRKIPKNAICIEIAPHGLLQAILRKSLPESVVNVALTKRGANNLEMLSIGLGKLYNHGLYPKVSNLYSKVNYPIETTTSISPLIKWDHAVDWYCDYYGEHKVLKEGTTTLDIKLDDPNYQYLQEYIINGQVAIPLSFYFIKTLEIFETFHKEPITDIVFENIKVHQKLITIPQNNSINMLIMVQRGTGSFEIVNSEELVMTGNIKVSQGSSQERLNINKIKISEENKFVLSQEDFYTELEMRGYSYSGDFKNVLKSSNNGRNGLVKWNNNLMAFIEGILQLYVFENNKRQVHIPMKIHKLIVDKNLHETEVSKSNDISVTIDKKLNCISAGGLEIQGVELANVTENAQKNNLVSDTLTVVPNVDKSNLSIAMIYRLILQLVLENTFSKKIQGIQFINDSKEEIINNYDKIMQNVPEASLFNIENVDYEEATFNKMLNIVSEDCIRFNLEDINEKLGSNKFLLIITNNDNELSRIKLAESAGLKVVMLKKTDSKSLILLRKKKSVNVKVIQASKNVKDSINKIKNVKLTSESERLIVLFNSESNSNLMEFLDQLEREVSLNRIRIYNILGSNVTENSFKEQNYYKNQLELDLLVNILTAANAWATLRHTTITTKPRSFKTWVLNKKHSQDKTNIVWTEGPTIKNNENTVKVEYFAINSEETASIIPDINENNITSNSSGLEFSGIDSHSNRVMGVTSCSTPSNYVSIDKELTWAIPKSWSLEDAATVPLSHIIAYKALELQAEVQKGENVFIDNPCNQYGPALLNVALQKKCNIYTIYKNEAEKKLIKSICPQIIDAHLFKFNDYNKVRDNILLQTKGKGVDVIICNQTRVKDLEIFFCMVKHNARCVLINDLGNNEIHKSIGLNIFLRELNFYSLVPRRIINSNSKTKKILSNLLSDGINTGFVKPLIRNVYKRESINEAFDAYSSCHQSGKVIVKIQPEGSSKSEASALPQLQCSSNKSYLIVEGLTLFALELIDWLVVKGAKKFVVASASKIDNEYKRFRFNHWQSNGIQITLHENVDLTQQRNINALFKETSSLGPIDGVFDLRRTETISNASSNESFNLTTKIIDEESRPFNTQLQFFIICSSIINTGSLKLIKKFKPISEIKSKDGFVENVLEKRKKEGLPALMIKWGLKESTKEYDNSVKKNIVLPSINKYLEKLNEIIGTEESIVEVSCILRSTNEIEEDMTLKSKADSIINNEIALFIEKLYETKGNRAEVMAVEE